MRNKKIIAALCAVSMLTVGSAVNVFAADVAESTETTTAVETVETAEETAEEETVEEVTGEE